MPCSDSTACYAIVQPKALNQGYVLSKNSSGVWYRADGYKLMKQSAYNNQYLSVSDNIALLAISYDNNFASYYSSVQTLYTPGTHSWWIETDGDGIITGSTAVFYGAYYSVGKGLGAYRPSTSVGLKQGPPPQWWYDCSIIYYSLIQ